MSRAQSSPPLKAEKGDLPEGWQHEQLDELSELVRDQIQPSAAAGLPYVGLEHIDPGEPTLKRWGNPEDVRSAKTRFASGDILYGKLRPYLDKSVLAPFAGICSTDILVLRAQADHAIAEFLVSAIHTKPFLEHAISTTAGVNHPRTSWNALKVHALGVPRIPEQRAIAAVLRTVQRAKEACERVLAATRQLKQSLLHHLFTYGPVPFPQAAHVPLKATEIGPMPDHWEVKRLGELLREPLKNGLFVKRPMRGSGTPYINVADLYANVLVNVRFVERLQIPSELVPAFSLKAGDVLFVRSSLKREGIAKAAIVPEWPEPVVFDCHLIKAAPNRDSIDSRFLAEWCRFHRGHKLLIDLSKTTTMTTIPQSNLSGFTVPQPPLEEQREIAAQFAAVDAKLACEEARRVALSGMFQSLLHHLMTGQVRSPGFSTAQSSGILSQDTDSKHNQ